MSKMKRRLTLAGTLVTCVLGGLALRAAWATPQVGVTATQIVGPVLLEEGKTRSVSPINKTEFESEGLTQLFAAHLRIEAGGQGGWHSHPGPNFVTVKSGTVTFYLADDLTRTPRVYPAGTGFVEDGNHVHNIRNETTDPVELVVLQLVPAGAPRRINAPQPAHYDF